MSAKYPQADDAYLLGATICDLHPFPSVANILLGRGLTAIYGVSGMGKTRLLEELAEGRVFLHVRAAEKPMAFSIRIS